VQVVEIPEVESKRQIEQGVIHAKRPSEPILSTLPQMKRPRTEALTPVKPAKVEEVPVEEHNESEEMQVQAEAEFAPEQESEETQPIEEQPEEDETKEGQEEESADEEDEEENEEQEEMEETEEANEEQVQELEEQSAHDEIEEETISEQSSSFQVSKPIPKPVAESEVSVPQPRKIRRLQRKNVAD
jgi:hypothetical protein